MLLPQGQTGETAAPAQPAPTLRASAGRLCGVPRRFDASPTTPRSMQTTPTFTPDPQSGSRSRGQSGPLPALPSRDVPWRSGLRRGSPLVKGRSQASGNGVDSEGDHSGLVHRVAPQILQANARKAWECLSAFTGWRPCRNKVLGTIGKRVPLPFDLNSLIAEYYNMGPAADRGLDASEERIV